MSDKIVVEAWYRYIQMSDQQKADFLEKIGLIFAATDTQFISKGTCNQQSKPWGFMKRSLMFDPRTSKKLCSFFGFTNLVLGLALLSELNLIIAILMFVTVAFYEYMGI